MRYIFGIDLLKSTTPKNWREANLAWITKNRNYFLKATHNVHPIVMTQYAAFSLLFYRAIISYKATRKRKYLIAIVIIQMLNECTLDE